MNDLLPTTHAPLQAMGESLVRRGLITGDQLAIALAEQRVSGLPLPRVLTQLGFVADTLLRDVSARHAGRDTVELATVIADPDALRLVPREFSRRHQILPLAFDAAMRKLTLAATESFDTAAQDRLRAMLGGAITLDVRLAAGAELADRIEQCYGEAASVDAVLLEFESTLSAVREPPTDAQAYAPPVVRLVDALLVDAVKRDASDLHVEPEQGCVRIRYHIDGVLETTRALHRSYLAGLTVRLKVLAGMNIAETRAAQDGRFSLTIAGRAVDFRASTQPTVHGENLVLRVLDREKSIVAFDELRLPDDTAARLDAMLARPEGLVVVTGPTGSGKTTTLYALLARLNDERVNIMTLEDPVEYHLPLLRQSAVSDVARAGFADGVRAILRQDPDVILIGEIRDAETADMALRAAMTGHQVYTTLHAAHALAVFPRLADLGLRGSLLAGNVSGIVAQRLVRVLCATCRQPDAPTPAERTLFAQHELAVDLLYRARGCPSCANKGYRGRVAIMEALVMNDELDDRVASGAPERELRQLARAAGFRSLAQDGLARVAAGVTSLDELARAVRLG